MNFIQTIERLSFTGEWIRSKKITANSIYYQRYMMQQNSFPNFNPYLNSQIMINQSLQFTQPNLRLSAENLNNQITNRNSISNDPSQVPVQYYGEPTGRMSGTRMDLEFSPIHNAEPQNFVGPDGKLNSGEKSTGRLYDTAHEQKPLPRPKANYDDEDSGDLNALMEFGNDQFNSKSNFKLSTKKGKKPAKTKVEDAAVGLGGALGGQPDIPSNLFNDDQPIKPKKKANKKKDLEKKKEFLKRRKAYDPRKAAQTDKSKQKSTKKHKSAFPKGFFKGKAENENDVMSESEASDHPPASEHSKSEKFDDEPKIEEPIKPSAKAKEKEVKIKKESRSERVKSRQKTQKQNVDSDEGSPERRLESTPQKHGKGSNKLKESTLKSKQQKDAKKESSQIKTKNVQFNKQHFPNVSRKIDCWKNKPVPPQAEKESVTDEMEDQVQIVQQKPASSAKQPKKISKIAVTYPNKVVNTKKPIAQTEINLNDNQPSPQEETRLIESLENKGEQIEIVEMDENRIPYKKVYVTKGDDNQFNVEVYEDNFTDDYDSAELSVPEERDVDEYVYSDQKPKHLEESSGSMQQTYPKDGSYGKL